jgi:hypothetical protein
MHKVLQLSIYSSTIAAHDYIRARRWPNTAFTMVSNVDHNTLYAVRHNRNFIGARVGELALVGSAQNEKDRQPSAYWTEPPTFPLAGDRRYLHTLSRWTKLSICPDAHGTRKGACSGLLSATAVLLWHLSAMDGFYFASLGLA